MPTLSSSGTTPLQKEKVMPNKAVSLVQFKLMQGIKHGSIHKPGLSPSTASEFLGHQSPKGLPKRVKSKSKIRLKKRS